MKSNEKNKSKKDEKDSILADIPLGLSSALSRNLSAMQIFAEMPDEKRNSFIEGSRNVKTKEEMRAYVSSITEIK